MNRQNHSVHELRPIKLLTLLGGLLCTFAAAQDINFGDLKRQGAPVVKQYTVPGTKADGERYVLQFEGRDGDRRATANAVTSSNSSAPGPQWQILRSESISRHNWVREIRMKCLQGPSHKIGSEHTIWITNDGRSELGSGLGYTKHKDFDTAAKFACSID